MIVSRIAILVGGVLVAVTTLMALWAQPSPVSVSAAKEARPRVLTLDNIPFNGTRAYEYLKQICALGPRPSGSEAMAQQQKLVAEHFKAAGAEVTFQNFRVRHPLDGSPVTMANLIARWRPDAKQRILLCAHYDTRPYPDQDPRNPRGTFVGANDGASGVALLMELAHKMSDLEGDLGVDFVLFDGEEFIFGDRGTYFLGSEYFALAYAGGKVPGHYRWGVLLDMIADADLQILQEINSLRWRDARPLIGRIWSTAARLGVQEFVPKPGYQVNDDHIPLHDIGKIPCCDVIDFNYPFWHTEEDTPDKCSALSLAKVGWVMEEWLKGEMKRR